MWSVYEYSTFHYWVPSLRTLGVFDIVVLVSTRFLDARASKIGTGELDETDAIILVRLMYFFFTVVAVAVSGSVQVVLRSLKLAADPERSSELMPNLENASSEERWTRSHHDPNLLP